MGRHAKEKACLNGLALSTFVKSFHMKQLALLVFCGLLAMNTFSQQRVPVTKSNIQQLQKLKIVAVAKNSELDIVSRMNDMESHMTNLQERQLQLQKELEALQKQQGELKDKLDSMTEMSETTAMRLQMMMDRRSKFMEALSNMMKKMAATSDSIKQNLK